MTIYGSDDGLGEQNVVHGDCLDGISIQGRTGGGGVDAWLDWTPWINGGAFGSAI